jgi:hypothetical protein
MVKFPRVPELEVTWDTKYQAETRKLGAETFQTVRLKAEGRSREFGSSVRDRFQE